MNGTKTDATPSPKFEWSPDCDELLKNAASSDYLEQDWDRLRDIIIHKLNENVASFLSDPPPRPPPEIPQPTANPPPSSGTTEGESQSGPSMANVKFPPFPIREVNPLVRTEFNSHSREKTVLNGHEAMAMKDSIGKQLQEFEEHPPFTIQRLCELIYKPRQHYKTVGKYLRAVERSILITSTIDAFPIVPRPDPSTTSSGLSFSPAVSLREATTPLFSPIPFLHEDARRSRSKSPPVSPLMLGTNRPHSPEPMQLGGNGSKSTSVVPVSSEGPVIGLVDELDDPKPGHMSDRPHALTSTTSTPQESPAIGATASSKPKEESKPMFGGSLTERFVKSSEEKTSEAGPDEGEEGDADKENVPK